MALAHDCAHPRIIEDLTIQDSAVLDHELDGLAATQSDRSIQKFRHDDPSVDVDVHDVAGLDALLIA